MTRFIFKILNALAPCIFLFLIHLPSHSDGARILGFFPSQSKSNLLVHCALADALAQAGHNVTVIGTMPNVYKDVKYQYIHLEVPSFDTAYMNEAIRNPQPIYKQYRSLMQHVTQLGSQILSHPRMQQFLHSHQAGDFDLLILGYFINDFHLGLAAHFKCPIIVSSTVPAIYATNTMVGNPHEVVYVPTLLGDLQQPMYFIARLKNFLLTAYEHYPLEFMVRRQMRKYYEIHFPATHYPSLDEVRKNISLVFCNNHFTQGPIRPNVPAFIEIGGIQIPEKPNPLPTDVSNFMDDAKDGVIFFSLGSNIQGKNLAAEKAQVLYNVLSKLPYKVIWKWGDTNIPGNAKNIMYGSWFPQNDILAHKNLRLFITHGGQGSIVEAEYHGVPIVGIPLFGDQPANMANVEKAGFGLSVDYKELTEENLRAAILAVMQDQKYANAVKKFSQMYRDRPLTPRQAVVYWTNYVLRYDGAKHMQSPAVHQNRCHLMSLDVMLFLGIVLSSIIFVAVKLIKFCCKSKKNVNNANEKKIN